MGAYHVFSDGILEYSGLHRQFLIERLAPFTLYTPTLEACTAAGCAHSEPQPLWTEEALPTPPPQTLSWLLPSSLWSPPL
ncbi:hypothetical protein U0070_019923 [Myodes glareolus]|uniref:Uncharacterized protein n=1 Tax=Myodes glareolus TaxID=447135 RepID=A0AAW0JKX1_MYOGA